MADDVTIPRALLHRLLLAAHGPTIRARGVMVTPFRLGIAVGETGVGVNAPNPYPGARASTYEAGVRAGRRRRYGHG